MRIGSGNAGGRRGRGGGTRFGLAVGCLLAVTVAVGGASAVGAPAVGAPAKAEGGASAKLKPVKPKYYFAVADIKDEAKADEATRASARKVLEDDLAARPEFTSDLGEIAPDALPDELRRRNLKGFHVTLKLTGLDQQPKPPRPGGRLPQLAVTAKVSVFGTTIPEAKLAFGGDGEATVEAEIVERRKAEEAVILTREVLVQAVHQAVDQAVGKLGDRASQPFNESKRRKPASSGRRVAPAR